MTAYSVGGGLKSYVTIGLECSGDDLSSEDLPGVRDEVQRIRVTRTYDDESYVSFTSYHHVKKLIEV